MKKLLTEKNKNKLLGYLSFLFLVAGTLRAIMLEADDQKVVLAVGILATVYAVSYASELRK